MENPDFFLMSNLVFGLLRNAHAHQFSQYVSDIFFIKLYHRKNRYNFNANNPNMEICTGLLTVGWAWGGVCVNVGGGGKTALKGNNLVPHW